LASLGRVFPVLFTAACVVAVIAGCGSGGDSASNAEVGRDSEVTADAPVVEIPTRWASANARDMKTLIASTGTVFVGEVTGLSEQRTAQLGGPTSAGDASPGDNPGDAGTGRRQASIPISVFEVTVVRSLAGGLAEGQTATLEQPGGVITRTDGSQARIILDGDEALTIGTRYLFFASVRGDGVMTSAPFARFTVRDDGSIAPLSEWSGLPVASQLTGVGLDDAAREVQAGAR
jgi:hypothetical protein